MSVKEKFEAILRKYGITAYGYTGANMEIPNIPREIDLYCDDYKRAEKATYEFIGLFNTLGQEEGDDGACSVLVLETTFIECNKLALLLGRDY